MTDRIIGSSSQKDKIFILYDSIYCELHSLNHYLNIMDGLIDGNNEKIDDNLKEEKSEIAHEEDFYLDTETTSWIEHVAPHVLSSFLTGLVSHLEVGLENICDDISKRKKIELSRRDLTGSVIVASKKYLSIFGGFKKPSPEIWSQIEAIYDVRNVIVHAGGDIDKSNLGSNKTLKYLERMNIGLFLHSNEAKYHFWRIGNIKDLKADLLGSDQITSTKSSKNKNVKAKYVVISANFCEFAWKSIFNFFGLLNDEHKNLAEGLRIVK
ncbi:MAG TPA: hypothetical protein DCY12_12250 [Candidatus Atribacteria bacterium]|nr:hypothetical protein [Candidatus Atribacteria bacterium]